MTSRPYHLHLDSHSNDSDPADLRPLERRPNIFHRAGDLVSAENPDALEAISRVR